MRYLSTLAALCLLSFAHAAEDTREVAAVFHDEEEISFDEMESLKSQLVSLQKQFEKLQAKDASLRKFLKEHLVGINKKIDELSQKTMATTSGEVAFGQKPKQDIPAPEEAPPLPRAAPSITYNSPAPIITKKSWDLSADASFIYWEPMQDNMDIGVIDHLIDREGWEDDVSSVSAIHGPTEFSPGFKVGAGLQFDYDKWNLHTEYTWLRSKATTSAQVPVPTVDTDLLIIEPLMGNPAAFSNAKFNSTFSVWYVHLDLIESTLGRRYHLGSHLVSHPYVGLRAALIHQKMAVFYDLDHDSVTKHIWGAVVDSKARSWGIGPEMGVNLEWTLYKGLRLLTSAEADLLYTQYTHISNSTEASNSNPSPLPTTPHSDYKSENLGCVRAHVDFELGLGYRLYTGRDSYALDLSATYGFQVFFNHNMFPAWFGKNNDGMWEGLSMIGNLYIQGLTAAVDFHF